MFGAVFVNIILVLLIAGLFGGTARYDKGYSFIGAAWVLGWLSGCGWVLYIVVHFVMKFW